RFCQRRWLPYCPARETDLRQMLVRRLPTKQRKANGNAHYPLPLTLFRMAATMLTQTLWQIAAGCTSKRATIMKQSKQDRSGWVIISVLERSWHLKQHQCS